MDIPAVRLLLEQGGRSLEDHTWDFLDLVCLIHYPNLSLRTFYNTSPNERSRHSPQESFTAYVEWVLVKCGSPLIICPAEEDVSIPDSTMNYFWTDSDQVH